MSVYMITREVYVKLLQACKNVKGLTQLHSVTIKGGIFSAGLINLYSKLANIETTRKLFDETPQRSVYIWNVVLRCYCREKRYEECLFLFSRLFLSERPDLYTISIALKACSGLKGLDFGRIIHGFVKKSGGISGDLFVGSALIDLYSKCGKMGSALCVFEEYSEPDTVLWTTVVTGYEQNGEPERALEFFARMAMTKGVVLDSITLVSVVSACAQMLNLKAGRSVHGYMIRMGFDSDLPLLNAMLSLYGKRGSVNAAANLFKKMEEKDVISWGSMVACYAHHGHPEEALDTFNTMIARGVEPNVVVLFSALQACEATGELETGKRIHELASRKGLDSNIMISTALIDMYMNCSSPYEAIKVFEMMPKKDAVCYSSLLAGCVQNEMFYKSVEIFYDMLASGIPPGHADMVKILTVCSELGILQQTSCIHGFAVKGGVDNNSFVRASLIESYAKCGGLDGAIAIFSEAEDRDVVIWSSMLAGYGFHGKGHEALELFDQMIKEPSVRPNDVSFVSILSACSHAGLVREGIEIFHMMVKDYQQIPNSKHYAIVVDLLGRIGELDKAMEFISRMPEPVGGNIWGALLGACRIYQNTEVGEVAASKLMQVDPGNAGHYVLLSNLYAVDEKWDNVGEVRSLVKERQLKKVSGQSVIELRDDVCAFIANDRSHQDCDQIYELLTKLEVRMKEECNVCSTDFLLLDAVGIS